MTIYCSEDHVTLHHGDCLDVLAELPDASVDSVVTDPPYGLSNTDPRHVAETITRWVNGDRDYLPGGSGFMGKAWDAFVPPVAVWDECLRVLKPGGHALVFAGSRTMDLMTLGLRLAGFEIRDSIAWLYGSGFPKPKNLDGEWQGWGTALKPAFEPIVVGRKPLAGTVAGNVLAHGTGALNIDGCRVGDEDRTSTRSNGIKVSENSSMSGANYGRVPGPTVTGRWPTNVILDEDQAAELDQQTGILNSGTMRAGTERQPRAGGTIYGADARNFVPADTYGDSGGASRFFPVFRYEAKAPSSERIRVDGIAHPTVKPLALMRWLARLVTPPGGTVLEPFAGSGTTVEACVLEGFHCIGIEREADYLPLIRQRLHRRLDPVAFLRGAGDQLGLFEEGA